MQQIQQIHKLRLAVSLLFVCLTCSQRFSPLSLDGAVCFASTDTDASLLAFVTYPRPQVLVMST